MKALVDLGPPFISLESTGDNDPTENNPLLLLAHLHTGNYAYSYQVSWEIALLLSRGANVNARNSRRQTCLHMVFSGRPHIRDSSYLRKYLLQKKDILILYICAGADVYAVDEHGDSVSDVASNSEQKKVWIAALKYCGIDINDVTARPSSEKVYSTAIEAQYSEPSKSVTSKVSLTEYLERREAYKGLFDETSQQVRDSPQLSSSEEDDDSDDGDSAEESSDDSSDEDEELAEGTFQNDESEDEVPAEEWTQKANANEQGAIVGSRNPHLAHKSICKGKGKAKLE